MLWNLNKIGHAAVGIVMLSALGSVVFFVLWSLFREWRKFQIHLSTAMVVMFVAGGILFANLNLRVSQSRRILFVEYSSNGDAYTKERWLKGIPFPFEKTAHDDLSSLNLSNPEHLDMTAGIDIDSFALVADFCLAIVVLFTIWLLSEQWIHWGDYQRRRDHNHPIQSQQEQG